MQAFSNVALPDSYGSGAAGGLFASDKGVAVFVSIFNNAAAFEILQRDPNRTTELVQSPEQASAPGSFLIEGGAGIKMRNNVAGSVARVFVTIFEPTDPRIAGFNPITATISASGAVSSAALAELAYNEFTAPVTISATTEATANAVVTAAAITASGTAIILVEFFAPRWLDATGTETVTFVLYEDGASIGQLGRSKVSSTGTVSGMTPIFLGRRFTPLSGSHTYSIRAFHDAGTVTIEAGEGGSGNLLPGFIRISQVA